MNKKERQDLAYHVSCMKNSNEPGQRERANLILANFPAIDSEVKGYDNFHVSESLSSLISLNITKYHEILVISEAGKERLNKINSQCSQDDFFNLVNDFVVENSTFDTPSLISELEDGRFGALDNLFSDPTWIETVNLHISSGSEAHCFYLGITK